MNRAKPIEAGCRAITYGCRLSPNNNKIVKVLEYVGDDNSYAACCAKAHWITTGSFITSWGMNVSSLPEKNLLRIDDPDIQKQIEGETITWQGKDIPVVGEIG